MYNCIKTQNLLIRNKTKKVSILYKCYLLKILWIKITHIDIFCWPRIVHLRYKTNPKKTDDIILYQYPISTLLIGETNTNFLVSLDK